MNYLHCTECAFSIAADDDGKIPMHKARIALKDCITREGTLDGKPYLYQKKGCTAHTMTLIQKIILQASPSLLPALV